MDSKPTAQFDALSCWAELVVRFGYSHKEAEEALGITVVLDYVTLDALREEDLRRIQRETYTLAHLAHMFHVANFSQDKELKPANFAIPTLSNAVDAELEAQNRQECEKRIAEAIERQKKRNQTK